MGGSILGHVVPGSAFALLTVFLWYMESHSLPLSKPRSAPLGYGVFLILATSIGLLTELIDKHGSSSDDVLVHIRLSKEHCTMYTGFFLAGLIALLETKNKLRRQSWRVALAGAFSVEGFLFYGHSIMQMDSEHNMNESLLHWILALACFFGATSTFASAVLPSASHEWTMVTSCFAMFQSLWFFFLAWALYSGVYGAMAVQMDMGTAMAYTSIIFLFCGLVCLIVEARWGGGAEQEGEYLVVKQEEGV